MTNDDGDQSLTPGRRNLITDVPGISVGHATDKKVETGVTVVRCQSTDNNAAAIAAADIRGGAPGARETDVLAPENLVGRADAIVLTGGSVFGLAAADGVTSVLSNDNVGLRLAGQSPAIPIVPAAVLHDLSNDGDKNWGDTPPYRALGAEAVRAARADFELGSVGAGTGAMAGAVKGGLGSASLTLENGVVVGALVAVNPVGSVLMSDSETFYAWAHEIGDEFGGKPAPKHRESAEPFPWHSRLGAAPQPGANTTLAIVATNADISNVEAKRVAIMAQDGIARAIRPAHTAFDGDIVFAIATASQALPSEPAMMRHGLVARIGAAAADCLARAIARGVYEAGR